MINLDLLHTFCKVYETGGMTAAARQLMVSQSTVSKRITQLERQWDRSLFTRSGPTVNPTPVSHRIYPLAKRVLSAACELSAQVSSPDLPGTGTISFAASNVPGQYLLPRIWHQFQSKHPGYTHTNQIVNSMQAFVLFTDQAVDLAFVGSLPDQSSLYRSLAIATDELIIIAPPQKTHQSIDNMLSRGPWIWREEGSAIRQATEQLLMSRGLYPQSLPLAGEYGSSEAVISAVRSGLGISCMSRAALPASTNVTIIDDLELSRFLYLLAPTPEHTPTPAETFFQFCTHLVNQQGPIHLSSS